MHLSELRIRNFRCFEHCDLEPAPGINLIVGDNATGKSSLLEALFYLGRGHSYRRSPASGIIQQGASSFTLNTKVRTEQDRTLQIGIVRDKSGQRLKVGNKDNAAVLDLVNTLPLQIIDPNQHRLLEEGPHYRRRYLDWGVFHVEHRFYPAWRRYCRALRQRNSALRNGQPKTSVIAWDAELVQAALTVDACRRGYVDALSKILPGMVGQILGDGEMVLDYQPGWAKDEPLGESLLRTLVSDQRSGFTHVGPHRADLRVKVNTMTARDWVSRGQQKVITAVLLLAQAALLDSRRKLRPVLLIDDLAAELGASYREAVFKVIEKLDCQCFMTFLEEGLIPKGFNDAAMFHVEHGRIEKQ